MGRVRSARADELRERHLEGSDVRTVRETFGRQHTTGSVLLTSADPGTTKFDALHAGPSVVPRITRAQPQAGRGVLIRGRRASLEVVAVGPARSRATLVIRWLSVRNALA